jgi:iron complex outermembrane receptor protein
VKFIYSKVMGLSFLALSLTAGASAETFNIPGGELKAALATYTKQTGVALIVSDEAISGARTSGAHGDLSSEAALNELLKGTGFGAQHTSSGAIGIIRRSSTENIAVPFREAATEATPVSGAALETVTVTSSKIGGDVQNIPIAITALSQEQLTSTQTAGGPDLVKQVPNLTFTKTNFTGYSIQIRGIGTQAISVTTDPAVAVAFNDIPFIRNHFFEQEFYDVSQVEVLRGPQGTLYGRNATAGVVNLTSAKPTDQFEASASLDIGNYNERRLEGMINVPITDDRLDLRVAGEWTKRRGYTFDETTDEYVDGRDLWSTRMTLGFKPFDHVQAYLVWEHFSEDDNRERSTKQLCAFDPGPSEVGPLNQSFVAGGFDFTQGEFIPTDRSARGALSQGCLPESLYSPQSYETPNGGAVPIVYTLESGNYILNTDPYSSDNQSPNLRVIQSQLTPVYKAKNDTVEFNVDYAIMPALTFTSQTGFNHDFLASEEDFNRFNSNPGIFFPSLYTPGGILCDPQLGCSDRFIGEDLSQEHAWQLNQEFRLASNFTGPFNFSLGANYLHYETLEDYDVFANLLTFIARILDRPSAPSNYTANGLCKGLPQPQTYPTSKSIAYCPYTDATPLAPGFDGQGHNYFRSENPYILNSYAGFAEANYQLPDDVKLTGGIRWTDDQKHFVEIPSEALVLGAGYPVMGFLDQQWDEWTGRAVVNWTPKLNFTDQTLVYASFSRGYKAGGANPPPGNGFGIFSVTHPLSFAPEFINAYEMGTKNTLLDGALTFNGSAFYYDYKGYQVSQIVDRTSVNLNFNANVRGAEIESTYEPLPGLRFNFAGGWEDTKLASGSQAIDLMDRTAGHPGWLVVKPSPAAFSNCILPDYVIAELMAAGIARSGGSGGSSAADGEGFYISSFSAEACNDAYGIHPIDPTTAFYVNGVIPPSGYDPLSVDPNAPANVNEGLGLPPNNGEGFFKNLTGNRLPNAPPFTVSFGTQYTLPLTTDWAGTARVDYYWQDYSWARVFNDNPYDRIRGYTNVNLTFIFTNQNGWQVMLYDKNVFDETAITGAFLNSDDAALTTNVFVTDPKLIGIRVTKSW